MSRERIAVIYSSATGNTGCVAEAIAEALGVEARDIREISPGSIAGARLIFVGSGVYFFKPPRRMVRFLKGFPSLVGVKAAVFGTYGAWPSQLPVLRRLLEEKGAEVIGEFSCPGEDRLTLGILQRGRPDEGDLERAREFAKQVARRAGYSFPESSL